MHGIYKINHTEWYRQVLLVRQYLSISFAFLQQNKHTLKNVVTWY